MKSVGEVMAIGRSFEESLQKSIRMLDTGSDGLVLSRRDESLPNEEQVEESLTHPDDRILYNVASAIALGMSTKKIYSLSAIDPWFIEKIRNIVDMGKKLPDARDKSKMRKAKQLGFSDAQIARAQKNHTYIIVKQFQDYSLHNDIISLLFLQSQDHVYCTPVKLYTASDTVWSCS